MSTAQIQRDNSQTYYICAHMQTGQPNTAH